MISARKWLASPSLLAPIPLPRPRETHFWYIVPDEVQQPSLLNQYMDLLSTSERDDVSCMKDDKLRKRALLARVLVRSTLARYTNQQLHPRSLNFRKNNYGKPEVEWQHFDNWDPPALHFNLSHTSSLIACGVAVDVPIGIDVEEKQRKLRNNILSFARRYFSRHEVDYLQAFSDPEIQRQEFIKLWTLKALSVQATRLLLSRCSNFQELSTFRRHMSKRWGGDSRLHLLVLLLSASEVVKACTIQGN
ncbi:uncharacterized protein LOC131256737 isoform X5 [Magnolia sinica]|uniref:uncharacterized protein LOC131256737 isoform X5 n=1 Tax=Magnolia sinica TaxID=86752 RepID=UPI00265AB651|nr:uncharacterized protein LOC131256737 isoform X5 [Magnolia sinica]